MNDNYESPYGFDPMIDPAIDTIAARKSLYPGQLASLLDNLPEEQRDKFTQWVYDHWYTLWMGPAIDALEDHLNTYLHFDKDE